MATYRLFPSTSGPSSAASYSGPFLAGLQFEVTTGGTWLDGYWWWVCPTGQPTVPQKFALWQIYNTSEGVLVATATVTSGTLVPGQWNYVALDTPVPLAVGVTYVASTGLSGGFPITDNQFGPGEQYSAGIIDGPLSAYSDITGSLPSSFGMNQGLFSTAGTDPTVNMPVDGFNSANFWLDVQIDTSGPAGTSYRLWPNFPLIGGQVSIDTGQETTGTEFWLSEPCTLDNLWFYSPPGVTLLPSRVSNLGRGHAVGRDGHAKLVARLDGRGRERLGGLPLQRCDSARRQVQGHGLLQRRRAVLSGEHTLFLFPADVGRGQYEVVQPHCLVGAGRRRWFYDGIGLLR